MKIKMQPWRPLPALFAAFLFLSALLNVDYPGSLTWRVLLPSLDVFLLLALLALATCCGKRALFLTGLTVAVLFLALRLFRIGDTAVPQYLNRPFNLYIDSGYLFGLYDLLETSARPGEFLLLAAAALTVGLAVIAASAYAWRAAARALVDQRVRISFIVASALIFGAGWVGGWRPAGPPAMLRLGEEIFLIREQLAQTRTFVARLKQTANERAAGTFSLEGLAGTDVLLFMVESYGRTVFTRPVYRPAMEATLDGFSKRLDPHGFKAVSTYLLSPTYGGSSWLAHDTLESGMRVANDLEDAALLRSSLPPMATYFRKNGYRTVSAMPGTRFAFPQGAYFDYEQFYYAGHFHYRGPNFGWASMPDQFVLDWVHRREFTQRAQPLFIRYVLISSHAAFNIQPPFVPDWDLIGDGHIYHDLPPVYYPIYWPNLENAGEAYLRSLDYEFQTIGDYLAKYVGPNTLIIIMGDHQPNLQLTDTGEPWSVPVHVLSRNPRLLEPFRKRGYTPGLIPDQPLPHAGMETFLPGFLEDFGRKSQIGILERQ
ncbi:MAG: hypothetical protein HY911_13305 [Desulfobacterales bacterium]|nr:hypothetical protein [Desulfobacterales bacterium]